MPLLSFFKATSAKLESTDVPRVVIKKLLQVEIARGLQNTPETRAKIRYILQILKLINDFNLLQIIPQEYLQRLFTYSAETLSSIQALCNLLHNKGLLKPEYCLDIILSRVDASRLILANNWKNKEFNGEVFHRLFLFEKERVAMRHIRLIDFSVMAETIIRHNEARELFTSEQPEATSHQSPTASALQDQSAPQSRVGTMYHSHFDWKVPQERSPSPGVISTSSSPFVTISELLKSQPTLSSPAESSPAESLDFEQLHYEPPGAKVTAPAV